MNAFAPNYLPKNIVSFVFQKKILQWMKGDDDAKLEEEYQLLKKSASGIGSKKQSKAAPVENKRKRKRTDGPTNKTSSDSNDSDQGKRSRKSAPGM